jgi:hypothetical protein
MKTSLFEKGIPMLPRACLLVVLLLAVLSYGGAGCIGGFTNDNLSEGDRCNPLSSHNECGKDLVCTGQGSAPSIPFCPENYCCAVDSNGNITSTSANCLPGCNGGATAICNAAMAGNSAANFDACVFTGQVEASAQGDDGGGDATTE